MAKTENLLQGRLGNLIFYQVKGVTRIRSVPLMVRNPETPAQQAVRKRLIVSVQFYRRLKDTPLKAVWQVAARDTLVNGYNLFLKRNIHAFNDRTLSTPSALSMTCGNLPRMNDLRMTGRSDRTVTLAWNNSLEADGRTAADRADRLLCGILHSAIFTDPQIHQKTSNFTYGRESSEKTPAEYGSLNNTFLTIPQNSPYSKWMSQYIVLQFS